MTIEKSFFDDTWEVHCDKCSYYEEFEVHDFSEVISEMKKKGWKTIKTEGQRFPQHQHDWDNICITCQHKEKGYI